MMKKVFLASLALLVLALIFLLAYNFAFRNNASRPHSEDRAPEETPGVETVSETPSEVVNPVNEAVISAALGPDGTLVYYSRDDQAFKRASFEGKDKVVLLDHLPGTPERILWSPKRDRVLLRLAESGAARWYLADLSTKTLTPLKKGIVNASWNHLGDKIYYIFRDGSGGQSLNMADPDGNNWSELAKLSAGTFFLAPVPQTPNLSFWNRPEAGEKTTLSILTPQGATSTLFSGQYGSDYLWAPSGERAAISSANGPEGDFLNVSLLTRAGGEVRSLAIPTLVSKLAWSQDGATLYFALPGGLPESARLPDDYYGQGLHSTDTFWKIDIATGKKTRLLDPGAIGKNFDSTDLFLSSREDALFFTDRITGKLYRIDL
jgi:hypothetical protein